ncbi:MAG: precorrin-2 C(20)-methyltransferase [Candidatus Hydrothermarchaeales archaeon]
MTGKLYGVGVGPGDPELVTPKALKVLNSVNIIFAPKSKGKKESLALSVVRGLLEGKAEIKELEFPMTKDAGVLEEAWENTVDEIYAELEKDRDVAFPTIGDPLFYSTFIYVMRKMKERHPKVEVEAVPGVTSLSACAVELKMPLGEGDERIAVLPASYGLENLGELSKVLDTIVLMKVSRNFNRILHTLEEHGLKEKAIYLSRCGSKGYYSATLDEMSGKEIDYFSMIIIRCTK